MVDILKNAATYEGGLDRGNIMLAARNIHETNPFLHRRPDLDHRRHQGRLPHRGRRRWCSTRSPTRRQLGTYEPVGDLINLEGQLGTYKTVQAAGASVAAATTAAPTTAG